MSIFEVQLHEGMSYVEVIEYLDAHEVEYDAIAPDEDACASLFIGGYWSDESIQVDFDEDDCVECWDWSEPWE